jgi:excisionase family DNA binding protein
MEILVDKPKGKIAMGFAEAAEATGLSKSFLRNAVKDPNPSRRLKTVRVNRRRLIREEDLRAWFETVASNDEPQTA